jgi:DNA-binding transcriptional regulator YhcF (GntR family)
MKKTAGGFLPLIYVDRKGAKPLYSHVYEGFRAAIVGGKLRAGERIPSTRALCSELKIREFRCLKRMLNFWQKAILRAA